MTGSLRSRLQAVAVLTIAAVVAGCLSTDTLTPSIISTDGLNDWTGPEKPLALLWTIFGSILANSHAAGFHSNQTLPYFQAATFHLKPAVSEFSQPLLDLARMVVGTAGMPSSIRTKGSASRSLEQVYHPFSSTSLRSTAAWTRSPP